MSDLKTTVEYELKSPTTLHKDGEAVEAEKIVLHAPSGKVSKECAYLKQAFYRAVHELQDDADDDGGGGGRPPTAGELMGMIATATSVDYPEFVEVGRKLLLAPNVAFVEGTEKLTRHFLDTLSTEDVELAIGTYMLGFTLASALSKT